LKGLQVCSSCETGRQSSVETPVSLWLFCRTQVLISCVWGTNRSLFSVCPSSSESSRIMLEKWDPASQTEQVGELKRCI